jgi:hypothetical protein
MNDQIFMLAEIMVSTLRRQWPWSHGGASNDQADR